MELQHCWSHEWGESLIFGKSLSEVYAEAREAMLAARVTLAPHRGENSLRLIRDRIMRELAKRGWRVYERIFPPSAPAMFQRGHYCLDAAKTTRSGRTLGVMCHFGSSEFLVRQCMLISEAVRRRIVDCAILALMTRDIRPYVAGRPACYEQAQRLIRVYGESAFRGIPIVLWGLTPDAVRREVADMRASRRACVQ